MDDNKAPPIPEYQIARMELNDNTILVIRFAGILGGEELLARSKHISDQMDIPGHLLVIDESIDIWVMEPEQIRDMAQSQAETEE